MKIKGQYRGHCQACGRIQVVESNNMLAKHGYTVPNGYFKGQCRGSDQRPLQVSRVITDAIIVAMNDMANRNQMHAEALIARTILPERAQRLTAWGSRVYQFIEHKQVAVMVAWHDATKAEQDMQQVLEIGEAESNARFARGHAKSLTELAAAVYGQPLIDRDAEELARVAERTAKTAPIAGAFRTKIAQKRELEALNSAYNKIRRVITDTYLNARSVAGERMYWLLPYDLHQWRAKHYSFVIEAYPELENTVHEIAALVRARDEIKARPVIK